MLVEALRAITARRLALSQLAFNVAWLGALVAEAARRTLAGGDALVASGRYK